MDKDNITHRWKVIIDPSHYIFRGHFPKEPVWPGVFLLEEVLNKISSLQELDYLESYFIKQLKFTKVVKPADHLTFDLVCYTNTYEALINNQKGQQVAKLRLAT